MPIFEFKCTDCGKEFELLISNSDKDKVKCPEYSSANIKQMLSLFNAGGRGMSYSSSNCGNSSNSGG